MFLIILKSIVFMPQGMIEGKKKLKKKRKVSLRATFKDF